MATAGFLLAPQSPSLPVLVLTYGVLGGLGFGLMFVPAQVAPGLFFDKRRSLATAVALTGTGTGPFIMAPLTEVLVSQLGWQNCIRSVK